VFASLSADLVYGVFIVLSFLMEKAEARAHPGLFHNRALLKTETGKQN